MPVGRKDGGLPLSSLHVELDPPLMVSSTLLSLDFNCFLFMCTCCVAVSCGLSSLEVVADTLPFDKSRHSFLLDNSPFRQSKYLLGCLWLVKSAKGS